MVSTLMENLLFAQDPPAQGQEQPFGGMAPFVFMTATIMIMFYFMLVRPNQKRERDRKSMIATLRKNDHVVTVGGIKGVVANVKPEDDEVVLRIDEATGAKMRVVLSSIARVVAGEANDTSEKKDS